MAGGKALLANTWCCCAVVPFGLALSSALPGGADSTLCKVTSERENLPLVQAWLLLLGFSVLPAVANDEDQHSHHELRDQESSNDIEDSEIGFRRDAVGSHKYNHEKMVTPPATGSPCLSTA